MGWTCGGGGVPIQPITLLTLIASLPLPLTLAGSLARPEFSISTFILASCSVFQETEANIASLGKKTKS